MAEEATTAEPLIRSEALSRADLRKRNPVSDGRTAIVYQTKAGKLVLGDGRLTAGEIWLDRPRNVYTVDVAPHQDRFDLSLPSKEEAFSFTAHITVEWRITDPMAAIRDNAEDGPALVRPYLKQKLRAVSRQFSVEDNADAEHAIRDQFEHIRIAVNAFLTIENCHAELSLDAETRQHVAARVRNGRQLERTGLDHELAKLREQHRQELEQLTQTHDLALKEERMVMYANALRADDMNLLALRLAGNGEDVNDVLSLVMQQRKLEFDGAHAVLTELLSANLVSHKDIAGIMAKASGVVVDRLRGRTELGIGAADQAPKQVQAASADSVGNEDPDDYVDDIDEEDVP